MLAIVAVAALSACTDTDGARRAVEAQGFDQVEITGSRFSQRSMRAFFGGWQHLVLHEQEPLSFALR
jgi:hypothetical protein